jgi:hypothetical protein
MNELILGLVVRDRGCGSSGPDGAPTPQVPLCQSLLDLFLLPDRPINHEVATRDPRGLSSTEYYYDRDLRTCQDTVPFSRDALSEIFARHASIQPCASPLGSPL